MNTRVALFDSPLFLGFDHFERAFDRLKKTTQEGYPPYNIEQIGEDALRITVAHDNLARLYIAQGRTAEPHRHAPAQDGTVDLRSHPAEARRTGIQIRNVEPFAPAVNIARHQP